MNGDERLCYHSTGMERKTAILYLLLNVLVSAVVVTGILFLYDRNRGAFLPAPSTAVCATVEPAVAETPAPAGTVQIVSVVGAGSPAEEVVVLRYSGQAPVTLTGWRLGNAGGNTYTFPTLQLFSGGTIQVHTGNGENTPIDLYWGQNRAMWQSGETLVLYSTDNSPQASYTVP